MVKEIEDALHMLLHCSLKDTEYETQVEQYKIVRNYITNLQQKSKKQKEVIDKAINLIVKETKSMPTNGCKIRLIEILDILNEVSE